MAYQPHELSNLSLVGKYLNQLPSDDISRRFYSGQKYIPSFTNRLKFIFATDSILSQLNRFYPYQPVVNGTYKLYQQHLHSNQQSALAVSAVSILALFYSAKQNITLPLFKKFGGLFKTHRLLKHYLLAAFLPYIAATLYTNKKFSYQTELLWATHAKRLNEKILTDPAASQYPRELLPVSQVGTWHLPNLHRYDLKNKWENETHIAFAPAYTEVDTWEKIQLADGEAVEQSGEQGGQEEAAAEQAAEE